MQRIQTSLRFSTVALHPLAAILAVAIVAGLFAVPYSRNAHEARAAAITVSGKLYSGEGTGALDCTSNNRTVAVSVNGGVPVTSNCTNATGDYSVTVTVNAAGDVLTVFLDEETEDANAITRTADAVSNITDLDLYQDRFIIRHEDAGPTTIANLALYDNNNDADLLFTAEDATPDTLTAEAGSELFVWAGDTFTPGGNLWDATNGVHDVDIRGTFTAGASQDHRLNGSWKVDGAFNASTSTVTFNATSGTETIDADGTGTDAFNAVTFNDAAGSAVWQLTTNMDVDGNFTISGGEFQAQTNTINIAGNWSNSDLFTEGSSTVIFDATSGSQTVTTNNTVTNGGGSAITETAGRGFNNVTISITGGGEVILAASSDLSVDGNFTMSANSNFDIGSNNNKIIVKGDMDLSAVADSAFDGRESTYSDFPQVQMYGASTQKLKIQNTGSQTFDSIQFGDIGQASVTRYLSTGATSGTLNFQDYLIILSGTVDTKDGANASVNVTGLGSGAELYVGDTFGEDSASPKVFNANGSTISAVRVILTDGQSSPNSSTFNAMTATISASDQIRVGDTASATQTFNTFDASTTSSATISANRVEVQVGSVVLGDSRPWDIGRAAAQGYGIRVYAAGTWDAATNTSDSAITCAGDFIVDTSGTFSAGSTTITLDGTVAQKIDPDADITFNNLALDDTGNRTVTIADFDTSSRRVTVPGIFTWDGTVAANAVDLQIGDATGSDTAILDLTNDTAASASVVVPTGRTLTMITTSQIELEGNWDNNGTFTGATSTITFDAAAAGRTVEAGASSFINATFSGTGGGNGGWTIQTDDLTVTTALSIDTGDAVTIGSGRTLTLSGNSGTTLTLGGILNGPGRLTYQNSATTFPTGGTLAATLITRFDTLNGDQSVPARTDYGVIEAYGGSANARTVTLGTGASQTITTSSNLLVIADAASPNNVTVAGATNNPTVNIGGDLDFTGSGTASEASTSGTGIWTVSGDVNFTGGTFTATAGNTFRMNGATKTITSVSQTMQNFSVTGGVVLLGDNLDVDGAFSISGGAEFQPQTRQLNVAGAFSNSGTFTEGSSTVVFDSGAGGQAITTNSTVTNGGGSAISETAGRGFNHVTINSSGTVALAASSDLSVDGNLTFQAGVLDIGSNDNKIILKGDWDASAVTDTAFDAREATYSDYPQVQLWGAATQRVRIQSGQTQTVDSIQFGDIGQAVVTRYLTTGVSTGTLRYQDYFVILSGTVDTKDAANASVNVSALGAAAQILVGDTYGEDSAGPKVFNANASIITADEFYVTDGQSAGNSSTFNAMTSTLTVTDLIRVGDTGNATQTFNTFDASTTSTAVISADRLEVQIGTVTLGDSRTWDFGRASVQQYGVHVYAAGTLDGATNTSDATIRSAGDFIVDSGGTFSAGSTTVVLDGTVAQKIDPDADITFSSLTLDDSGNRTVTLADVDTSSRRLTVTGTFTWDGTVAANAADVQIGSTTFTAILDLTSDTAANSSITIPSGRSLTMITTSSIELEGSWDNNGTFTAASSTVTFDAPGTSRTVEAGASAFSALVFNNAAGGWTVQTNNLSSANLTLQAAAGFTVESGRTVTVTGTFSHQVAAANTTWTGSTLYLNGSGGMYDINGKTHGGDTYGTLQIGASEDIAMWDSSATTVTVDAGGCLFSEDHAATAGRLNISGTCNSRTNEYWSYGSDFDGVAATRQAVVQFASGASLTVDSGDSLSMTGQNTTTNRTQVTRQSSGNYGITIAGTLVAQNYDFDYLDASGLNITSTATVTEIAYGSFDNNGAGATSSYITVSGMTDANIFDDVVFDANADGSDANVVFNVTADGSGINWTFNNASGNHAGPAYERELNGARVNWSTQVSTVNDGSTTTDVDLTNVTNQLAANWKTAAVCSEDNTTTFAASDGYNVKDFTIAEKDGTYHIFHIRDQGSWWIDPNATTFGHETTTDFSTWRNVGPLNLLGDAGEWNDQNIWSPDILKVGSTYYMYFTGVTYTEGQQNLNKQRIGLATSTDLSTWTMAPDTCSGVGGEGCVLDCNAAWTNWNDGTAWTGDCRDPHVFPYPGGYMMLVALELSNGQQSIAYATSTDLFNWTLTDDIAVTNGSTTEESATVIEKDGTYFLFWSNGGVIDYATTTDPTGAWTDRGTTHRHFANELIPYGPENWTLFPYVHGDTYTARFQRVNFSGTSVTYSNITDPSCQSGATTTIADRSPSTAVDHFESAIGSTAGGNDVAGYLDVGLAKNGTRTGLSLANGSTYYVTVRALDGNDEVLGSATSDGITIDTVTPTISNIAATATTTTLTITWQTNEAATSKVNYGLTSAYGSSTTETSTRQTSHSVTISGLTPGTTYHFQATGSDQAGNTASSTDQTATTSSLEATVITNVQVTALSATSVRITWTTNHAADSKVRYGATTDYGLEKYDATLVTSHSVDLTGLSPGTQYHYEVISSGNSVAIDADATFTTPAADSEEEATIDAPTILKPLENEIVKTATPTIAGLAPSESDVFLLLDGELLKVVKAKKSKTGTGSFRYRVRTALAPGIHTLTARVRLSTGDVSPESDTRTFTIALAYPKPVVLPPIVRDGGNPSVTIYGFAKRGSVMTIFLDGEKADEFSVRSGGPWAAMFKRTLTNLASGDHRITVRAASPVGKPSATTDPIRFTLNRGAVPRPNFVQRQTVDYLVKAGDSLWRVAEYLYGDGSLWRKIVTANVPLFPQLGIFPHIIVPGWLLRVP